MAGVASSAFVCGTLASRFLSTSSTFQVSACLSILAAVYMRAYLPDSIGREIDDSTRPILKKNPEPDFICSNGDSSSKKTHFYRRIPSLEDMVSLLKTSVTFTQVAIVAFFYALGEGGVHSSLLYFLKAQFHFNKNQFADLMLIAGVAGTISQLLLMPILAPTIGEEKLLTIGLLASCTSLFLYSVSWTFWVPYLAAMFSVVIVFAPPCMRSIASKQVGPEEQGKAQGVISSICSFANIIAPLAFSPLSALFLSENAPFRFPGFTIMCIGFASMIAFIQSIMIRAAPPILGLRSSNKNLVEA